MSSYIKVDFKNNLKGRYSNIDDKDHLYVFIGVFDKFILNSDELNVLCLSF